jgi:hypothetical protein
LDTLCAAFGLTPFERDLLLLCAGVDLDAAIPALCARLHGDAAQPSPTLHLALAALPGAHWNALAPNRPLRRWRMIEIGPGSSLTHSPLRIDERILHYLAGVQHLDERIAGLLDPAPPPAGLTAAHAALAEQIADLWLGAMQSASPLPPVQLYGESAAVRRALASAACAGVGLNLLTIAAADVPSSAGELEGFMRLWEREVLLSSAALLVELGEDEPPHPAQRLIDTVQGATLVSSARRRPGGLAFEAPSPSRQEQAALWRAHLRRRLPQSPALNGEIDSLAAQFSLTAAEMDAACQAAAQRVEARQPLDQALWDACREQLRTELEQYAQRLHPVARWENLVLPAPQLQTLREIAIHVRRRTQVYEQWGFGERLSQGLGISALFAGPSGTGKTLAAEVLANELRLDLYRIDLSAAVSKYIGETEKNLRRIFDGAERSGAVLLFDEADALFGKRSEVKDSHDRYANIEVSYLLQRMESYRGLAILTTNLKHAIDPAFLRRIRFVVQFPFPDVAQRAQIWQRMFPAQTPLAGVDMHKLARLGVAGGSIRNIALHAAFLAADAGQAVGMAHLLAAARSECLKLEKTVSEAEVKGWV